MFVLITFILLFLSIATVIALRFVRRGGLHTWLITVGVLLTWGSVPLWQFNLPWRFAAGQWMSAGLFSTSPQLFADPISWLYALSLVALVVAAILTSPARSGHTGTSSWPEMLGLAGLGLLAVLVDNPLGLALAWTAIDLAQFVMIVRKNSMSDQPYWLAFAIRLVGTAFVLWAGVIGTSSIRQTFSLETTPAQAGVFLVIATCLRLGALPFSLVEAQPDENAAQRGVDTVLQMTLAMAGLPILARIPLNAIDPGWVLPLLVMAVFVALYNGWKWLSAQDGLQGRPHWLMGLSALSLIACLAGNPAGSAAWGSCLILFGGISFLYSVRQIWLTRIFALASLLMLALPFTLTAAGWLGKFSLPWVFWPFFIIAHSMLAAGYLRHLFRPSTADFAQLPNWAQATYTLGMGVLVVTILLGSLWGWPGVLILGNWQAAIAVFLLSGAALFVSVRLPRFAIIKPLRIRRNKYFRFSALMKLFARIFSFFYQLIGSLSIYISDLLEGDGGLLWTLLLLILLISFLRGQ